MCIFLLFLEENTLLNISGAVNLKYKIFSKKYI